MLEHALRCSESVPKQLLDTDKDLLHGGVIEKRDDVEVRQVIVRPYDSAIQPLRKVEVKSECHTSLTTCLHGHHTLHIGPEAIGPVSRSINSSKDT